MKVDLDTGWHPTIEEYHALAKEGVWSSSMIWGDFLPPYGHPRLARARHLDRTKPDQPWTLDMWRGTLVDAMCFDGARFEIHTRGRGDKEYTFAFFGAPGKSPICVVPPIGIDKRTSHGKWSWGDFTGVVGNTPVMGLSASGRLEATGANAVMAQAQQVFDWINGNDAEPRPGGVIAARRFLAGKGESQLSHRFKFGGLDLRWRPDRIVEIEGGGYAHVSLKVTKHKAPRDMWRHYGTSWRARDAFYELGWSYLVSEQAGEGVEYGSLPWTEDGMYIGPEPLQWVIVAAHHDPVPQCYCYVVPEEQKRLGRRECREGLSLLRECVQTNQWSLPEEREVLVGEDPKPWEFRK